jgi:hypothetical protein
MDSNLVYVRFKRKLFKADLEKQLQQIMEEKIKSLPNHVELRLHPELILLCCQLVENSVTGNKKLKLNKKQLVIDVLTKIFNYNVNDVKQADEVIEFLHSAKKIHRVKMMVRIGHLILDWVKRKFL